MYTYTAELFPTNVRTVGLGLGSLGGGLGGIIAPYILTLQVRTVRRPYYGLSGRPIRRTELCRSFQ